jgi:hypothetical protein
VLAFGFGLDWSICVSQRISGVHGVQHSVGDFYLPEPRPVSAAHLRRGARCGPAVYTS